MKEKWIKMIEKLKEVKKAAIVIAVALFLVIGALSAAVLMPYNNSQAADEKAVASAKKENADKEPDKQEADQEDAKVSEPDQAGETEEVPESTQQEEGMQSEQAVAAAIETTQIASTSGNAAKNNISSESSSSVSNSGSSGSSTSSSDSANGGSSNSNQSKPAHTHDWKKEWVDTSYDKEVEIAIGNQSGEKIEGDPNEYILNNNKGDTAWHSETEVQRVEDGYYIDKCSCGATK